MKRQQGPFNKPSFHDHLFIQVYMCNQLSSRATEQQLLFFLANLARPKQEGLKNLLTTVACNSYSVPVRTTAREYASMPNGRCDTFQSGYPNLGRPSPQEGLELFFQEKRNTTPHTSAY
ncbi:hypothetical protein IF2G_05736 [Cordyceps javanica]|nr:hypothetical protein IF2G_05736 [Cordyceps javanica]